jgi:flagellar L-ring protein precursor FlgH
MTTMMRRIVLLGSLLLMPALATAQKTESDTASPHPRRSWTSDRREFSAGDVITVMVDENTLASANKGQSGSDVQSRANDVSAQGPTGILAAGISVAVGSDKNSSSSQTGNATRDLTFKGQMSVRVVSVASNGVLEVKGARTVDIDKNKQQLTLSGFVRPEDVSKTNTIASSRIADAQVVYTLTGDLGGTRGGIISRLVSVFWP